MSSLQGSLWGLPPPLTVNAGRACSLVTLQHDGGDAKGQDALSSSVPKALSQANGIVLSAQPTE